MKKFIAVKVRSFIIQHGYDSQNKPIEEEVTQDKWQDKIFAVDRILSITEKYLLTSSSHDRQIYWEYDGGLKGIAKKLKAAKLLH